MLSAPHLYLARAIRGDTPTSVNYYCPPHPSPPFGELGCAYHIACLAGIFDYVMVARGEGTGAPLATPDLEVSYTSYPDDARPRRPQLPRPAGACNDIMNADDNWTKGGGRWA
eukprot:COSAG06_NODE_501_length_14953_cov_25.827858_8_plen_113_part_00